MALDSRKLLFVDSPKPEGKGLVLVVRLNEVAMAFRASARLRLEKMNRTGCSASIGGQIRGNIFNSGGSARFVFKGSD